MHPDNNFTPAERLFLRLNPVGWVPEVASQQKIPLNEVRFPDFSVNREKYSRPEDVLRPNWPDYGIASFRVMDVPESLVHEQTGHQFDFRVEHVPEPDNYAHSEVRTYEGGQRARREPSKAVRLRFRAILQQRIILIREPVQP